MAYDRDEMAVALRGAITKQSKTHMPATVRVTVINGSAQHDLGWIWGNHAGKKVKVWVGNAFDVSSGEHVLRCYPPNPDEPGAEYVCVGQVWNGADNSRIPRLTFKGPDGNTYSGEHTHSEYAAASHTHTAGSITDLFNTVSGYVQPGTGMVFSYAGSVITIHNTATGAGGTGAAASDESVIVATAGIALSQGERVYLSSGIWQKVDADLTGAIGRNRGVVTESIASGATGLVQTVPGTISNDFTGLNSGTAVWAAVAAGGYTQARPEPTAGGAQVAIDRIGMAINATDVMIESSPVVFVKRNIVAAAGTLTLVHIDDDIEATSRREFARSISNNYGSDQCSGGTPSANIGTAANAVDDNTSTFWTTDATALPHWWQYQFAAAKTIRQYTIKVHPTPTYAPKTWTLQASNTGAFGGEEVTLDTQTGVAAWSSSEKRTYQFLNYTAYTYYRLVFTASQASATNGPLTIVEIEMMESDIINERLVVGSSSSTCDVSAVAGDTSYANRDTQTTFTNEAGTTLDVIVGVEIN